MNGYVVPETNDSADDAYDKARQEELDAADALRAHEDAARRPPVPQPCHKCTAVYAGISCPSCKEDRPAFALLKKLSAPRLAATAADDTDLARVARHCGAL